MWLRNGAGSKRVSVCTADTRAWRPLHKPSAAVPIGVTAPIPVMTTRRKSLMSLPCIPGLSARVKIRFRGPFDPRQRARCDAVNEDWPDYQIRGQASDEWPTRPVPGVHDLDVHTSIHLHQPPDDLHSSADTPHVPIPDFAGRPVDSHLGHPPRGIPEEPTTERPPGGHLDQSVVEYADPAVMRKDRRPPGDPARGGEDARERREDTNAIDGAHQRLRPALPPL